MDYFRSVILCLFLDKIIVIYAAFKYFEDDQLWTITIFLLKKAGNFDHDGSQLLVYGIGMLLFKIRIHHPTRTFVSLSNWNWNWFEEIYNLCPQSIVRYQYYNRFSSSVYSAQYSKIYLTNCAFQVLLLSLHSYFN